MFEFQQFFRSIVDQFYSTHWVMILMHPFRLISFSPKEFKMQERARTRERKKYDLIFYYSIDNTNSYVSSSQYRC